MADTLLKFMLEGAPVRGMLVRLEAGWTQALARRAAADGQPEPAAVQALLGEMAAAALLMQANLKFDGAVVLQLQGDGPLRLAVAESQPDLSFRVTAKLQAQAEVAPMAAGAANAPLAALVNRHGQGRCAVTLDPRNRQPGQQPYQGVVPLGDADGQPWPTLAEALRHYMEQSEQLATHWVLAANGQAAAGLLIQRLPLEGGLAEADRQAAGARSALDAEAAAERADEDFRRIALLAGTLGPEELLAQPPEALVRRLFWEETLRVFDPQHPRFACRCSRERVAGMLRSLGQTEVQSIIDELGAADVGCDFCGQRYQFDAVDAAALFANEGRLPPGPGRVQ